MTAFTEFEFNGGPLRIDAPDVYMLQPTMRMFLDPELVERFRRVMPLPDDPVILDIGANMGGYSMLMATIYPRAAIHAVEASSFNCDYLRRNIAPYPNVRVYHFAAHDKSGSVEIAMPLDEQRGDIANTGHLSIYGESDDYRERMDARMLDDVFERADFIKIDIEGHTIPALNGTKKIIEECRPILQLEMVHNSYKLAGIEMKEVFEYVIGMGYVAKYRVQSMNDAIFFPAEVAEVFDDGG